MDRSSTLALRHFQRRVMAIFAVVGLSIAGLALGTWKVAGDAAQASGWVSHTYEVLDRLASIRFETLRAEFATQNFRITGDPSRLQERDQAVAQRTSAVERLQTLFDDNPRQRERLARLQEVIAQRMAISRRVEQLRRTEGEQAATAYANSAPLVQTRQRTAQVLNELETTERSLLQARLAQQQMREQQLVVASAASSAILLALLAGGYLFIRRQNATLEHRVQLRTEQLEDSEVRLQAYQRQLEDLVESRTAQLAQAHREFKAIFDHAPVGISITRDRHVVNCNRRMEELFGWNPGELTGLSTRLWFENDEAYESFGQALFPALAGAASSSRKCGS